MAGECAPVTSDYSTDRELDRERSDIALLSGNITVFPPHQNAKHGVVRMIQFALLHPSHCLGIKRWRELVDGTRHLVSVVT